MEVSDFLSALNTPPPAPTLAELAPVDLALDLLDFQIEGRDFCLNNRSSYLAYDMGLGKSAIGISVAASAAAAGQVPVLIVVPPSLRMNWLREIKKFAPWLKGAIIRSTKPKPIPSSGIDVIIIGDSTLTAWEEELTGKVKLLIVDEAHRHKNDTAKRAKSLARIAESVPDRRILLSGTPIPNGRHRELASQFDILGDPAWNAVGGKGRFWGYYCPKKDSWGNRGNNDSIGLHEDMKAFMLRRRRDDVIELPNKGRSAIAIEASGKEASKYKAIEQDLIAFLRSEGKDPTGAMKNEALTQLGYLRRAAGACKVEGIVQHVEELLDAEPGGVFVVAENHAVMEGIFDGLLKHGVAVIQGGMTDEQKTSAVDGFTSGAARVLIGQIAAAGTGLTLHGNGTNRRVVVAQLPWNPADLRQAEDRLHRIGQTKDVYVEIALCSIEGCWTIDERLWSILETKSFDTGETIDGQGEYLLEEVQEGVLNSYKEQS